MQQKMIFTILAYFMLFTTAKVNIELVQFQVFFGWNLYEKVSCFFFSIILCSVRQDNS